MWQRIFPVITNKTIIMKKIIFIDLFAGCGGIAEGFRSAGMECAAANEFDEKAAITYRSNFNHPLVVGDITLSEVKQILYDLVGDKMSMW